MTTQSLSGNWNYPTNITFGAGTIKQLPNLCKKLNIKKPLLITDEGLANADITKNTISLIPNMGIFSKVKGNPTGKNIKDGTDYYKNGNFDGIIAFGGGSGIDAAKAIALMAGQNRPLWDFEDIGDNFKRVNTKNMAPVIAIPTTSGTGSEVGRASVITNEDTHQKKIIFHPQMLPEQVVCDPELTLKLPPHLTAATGIDAFTHSFEAFCSNNFHPMADGIALESMRLCKENLEEATNNNNNLTARANMLAASLMGATAFQKGLGATHALAHPLGAIYDKHHGLLNAILLPYVMQRNHLAIKDKMTILARHLELKTQDFNAVLTWLLNWRKSLNIPHNLAEIGIPTDNIKEIGKMAVNDPSAASNPIHLTSSNYTEILQSAITGKL